MFPPIAELRTESDVEQKLVWPLLTAGFPEGFSYSTADIATKLSIRRLEIGKGAARKLYYPDYIVVLAGLPVMVVEAKTIGESLQVALDEARLYANEINALFPHGVNPCIRVVACNGDAVCTAPADSSTVELELQHAEMTPANINFARLITICSRDALHRHAESLRHKLKPKNYERPAALIGGQSFQSEELPQNTFGATIAGDYGHIFNPKTREDRALIAREAYIGSTRQQRYVEPIDRLVRNAVAPIASKIRPMADTSKPQEILAALQDRKKLENQVLLLVGSVGAGKSTFVDYLAHVALPEELRERTVWLRLNLNDAPLSETLAYSWVAKSIVEEFRVQYQDIDFDSLAILEKLFGRELATLKRGALAVLDPLSSEFRVRIADKLLQLQSDILAMAKAIAQHICAGPNRLLVVVLDNCDKRSRDEQLTMFQVASWVQSEFRCLVVLPLRDVTFDLHRNSPPLDTALKQFVFRIEPPQFSDVLQARVRLALKEIGRDKSGTNKLSFQLPNGMRVTYPAEDQALYLASILRSLYAHDRFVRQVMTGLAGRDVRKALELFLDFCMSGHIGEDEIYKIRFFEGQHVLPLSIVARVLLRMHRRFYDGNRAHLKNIVQCDPFDALPDHFVRLTVLHWLEQRLRIKGPAGVEGFHRTEELVADLASLGHDADRVRADLLFLAREGCLVAEHLRSNKIDDGDLLKITASGVIHLQLMANPEYLAACAEDTWLSDAEVCKRIAARLSQGQAVHFSPLTTARNAKDFVGYLKARAGESLAAPGVYLEPVRAESLNALKRVEDNIVPAEVEISKELFVGGIPYESTELELREIFVSRGIPLRSVSLLRDSATGRNRGCAFIEPTTPDGVLAALDLHNSVLMGGRRLRINDAHRDENSQKAFVSARATAQLSRRIFIGNLPYTYGDIEVRALLSNHDLTPTEIFILTDKQSGRSKGSGFVELKTLDDAAKAIGALNGTYVGGRKLMVRAADPKEPRR
jgi:hypothetical protein